MKLFGQLVRTVVNVVVLPVAVVKDITTLGGTLTDHGGTYTGEHLDKLKDEASEGNK